MPLCLTVEFPANGLVFADFTAAHPGATVDILGEPAVVETGLRHHPFLFLVQGADPKAVFQLEKLLTQRYELPRTLRRDMWSGRWLGRMRMREEAINNAAIQAWTPLARLFGPPWTHVEGGQYLMRAVVADPKQGEVAAAQVNERAKLAGVEIQADLREVAKHDFSVWDELVQAALGLNPEDAPLKPQL